MTRNNKIPSLKITGVKQSGREEKDFELYRFDLFAQNIDHLQQPHIHDHFALFFVAQGKGSHLIDFQEYKLLSKRIFLIAPGQVHAWKAIKGVQGYVLLFTFDFFTLTLQYSELRSYLFDNMISQTPYLDLDAQSFAHIESIFKNMDKESTSVKKYRHNIIRSYINIILFEVARIYERTIPLGAEKERTYQLAKQFTDAVENSFRTIQTVNEYATLLHITPSYLNVISKKHKGRPAGKVIHDRIMLEAKRMLAHSTDTVAQISYNLSFEDNSYFGRFFKKHTGKTPAGFRAGVISDTITGRPKTRL